MAVINNHSSISLDANFQGKHTELLQYFFNQGLNIEVSDDFAGLKTFLTSSRLKILVLKSSICPGLPKGFK